MATRLQKIQQYEDEEAAQQYLPAEIPEEIEETATDRVASMLAGINGLDRAELKVYKIKDGSLEYCQGFKPEQFEEGNFDLLRDRFGHGEFELRLYATHPQTRKFGIRSKLRVKMSEVNKAAMSDNLPSGLAQVLDEQRGVKRYTRRPPLSTRQPSGGRTYTASGTTDGRANARGKSQKPLNRRGKSRRRH